MDHLLRIYPYLIEIHPKFTVINLDIEIKSFKGIQPENYSLKLIINNVQDIILVVLLLSIHTILSLYVL